MTGSGPGIQSQEKLFGAVKHGNDDAAAHKKGRKCTEHFRA